MTRTIAILTTLCFPTLGVAGSPADFSLPMEGDAVRVLFSADCGPCQADLAAAQALHDSGVRVMIESADGIDGFAEARAIKARPAPTVPMVTAPGGAFSRSLVAESRAMTGYPMTLSEMKAAVPTPEASMRPALESRIELYDAALNALWQD